MRLLTLCDRTLQEPGCSLFTLHHDTSIPTRFVLWERFDDEAAYTQHFEEAHTKAYLELDLTEVVQHFQTNIAQH
ncbi:MAG: carboxymuconolactone decarboxylase [Chloroflexi bacterium AL-W]|nr:carboxymuconolactone decarboxylase [Chloroflexi bacterium AL-N1]NOK70792.1 carboxymuconolactone decarboxylase [Chloroflexi bacterium AL-N10]NOK78352.1 carboxymuconolactone decarboxylase [Chloroflexi bacterium AL-N5]NOK85333.1 carboxymuconolactone decarboxylase [Chloroflexi bacterium AL-W]NOK92609.1 carboxymuconolactone decarboxylase [Chloroflexi bacterium AL-N15]